MNFSYDYLNRFITPKITLCNPDSVYDNGNITRSIGVIQNVKNFSIDYNFNSYSQGSFECEFSGDISEGTFLFLTKRRYIFIEKVGFCIITECSEDKTRDTWVKKVTFCTCDKELENYESPMLVTDDTSMTLPLYSPNENTNDMIKTLNNILWNWTVQCDDDLKFSNKYFINENNLPSDYRELPYVQLNGSTYIDTGYTPKTSTTIEIEAQLDNSSKADGCLFGSRGYSDTNFVTDTIVSNKFLLWHNTVESDNTETISFHNGEKFRVEKITTNSSFPKRKFKLRRYEVEEQGGSSAYYYDFMVDDTVWETIRGDGRCFTQSDNTNTYHLYIGALNQNGRADYRMYRGRIYSCKIYQGSILQREFIPCVRKSDGKIGLYDKVNNVFYPSKTNSDFVFDYALYATFTEQSSNNMFEFLYNDIQKQYDVVVDCDYVNHIITLHSKDSYQNKHQSDIRISNDLYNSISLEDNIDDEYTGYNISGDDNITVSSVNPMGNNIIYDFSKYQNESWMTSELNSAINKWRNNVEKSKPIYQGVNKLRDTAFSNVSTKIQNYEKELQNAETNRQLFVNAYDSITADNSEYTTEALNQFAERYQKNLFGGLNSNRHLPITLVPEKVWNQMFTDLFRDDDYKNNRHMYPSIDDFELNENVTNYYTSIRLIYGSDNTNSISLIGGYKSILDGDYTRSTIVNGKQVDLKLLDYYCLDESQNIVEQIMTDNYIYGHGSTIVEVIKSRWRAIEVTVDDNDIKEHLQLILQAAKEYYIGCKKDKENIFFISKTAEQSDDVKRLLIPDGLRGIDSSFKDMPSTEYIPIYPMGQDTIYTFYDARVINYRCNGKDAGIFATSDIYYVDKESLNVSTTPVQSGKNKGKRLIKGYYWLFDPICIDIDHADKRFFFDIYFEDIWDYYCMPYTGFRIPITNNLTMGSMTYSNNRIFGKFFSIYTLNNVNSNVSYSKWTWVDLNMYNIHYGLYHYGMPSDDYNLYGSEWYKPVEDNGSLGDPNLSTGAIGGHDMGLHCWKNIIFYRFKDNSKLYLYAKYYYDKVPIQNYMINNSNHCKSYTRKSNSGTETIRSYDVTYTGSYSSSNNYNVKILKATFWWNSVYWARQARVYSSTVKNVQTDSSHDWQTATEYEVVNCPVKMTYIQILEFIKAINTHCGFNAEAAGIFNIISDTSNINGRYGSLYITASGTPIWTEDLLRQLICYTNVGKYTNQNITVNDSMSVDEKYEQLTTLMSKAEESLGIAAQGVIKFSIDNKNFIFDRAFAPYAAQLKTGCSVLIEKAPNVYETVFLSSFSVNYSEKTISLTFGDRYAKFDIRSLFDEVLGDVSRSSLQIKKLSGRVAKLESKN